MIIFFYYLFVSIAYFALWRANSKAGQIVVPYVVLMLIIPAIYGEYLRVKYRRRRGH